MTGRYEVVDNARFNQVQAGWLALRAAIRDARTLERVEGEIMAALFRERLVNGEA